MILKKKKKKKKEKKKKKKREEEERKTLFEYEACFSRISTYLIVIMFYNPFA